MLNPCFACPRYWCHRLRWRYWVCLRVWLSYGCSWTATIVLYAVSSHCWANTFHMFEQAQLNWALLKRLLLVCHLTSCAAMIAAAHAIWILISNLNLGGATCMLFSLKKPYNTQESLMRCRATHHCNLLHCSTGPIWQQSWYHMGLTGRWQALADSPDESQSTSRTVDWMTSSSSLHDNKCTPCVVLGM